MFLMLVISSIIKLCSLHKIYIIEIVKIIVQLSENYAKRRTKGHHHSEVYMG